jgi:ABC-2 type transport system permease protein
VSELVLATEERDARPSRASMYTTAFLGLMLRDTRVLLREFLPFLTRTVMNPLLFVFVFTYVFPKIGQGIPGGGGESFATILVPGLVAVAMVTQGIFAAALPLVTEFGTTHEIEDRVMAPLPVGAVALEKVTFSALQAIIAGLVVFPLVYLVPTTPVTVHVDNWPLLIVLMVLCSFTSGALGLAIGTSFNPRQVSLIFAMIVVPMTFLGCVYYPWARLEAVRWLQIVVLINPVVYMSEGLRTTLTPGLPHMHPAAILGALCAALFGLSSIGVRNFIRRVRF